MIAYKFLRGDGTSVFSNFRWPLPENGSAGVWVEAPVDPCRSGIHACRLRDLPYWVAPLLFEIELNGEILEERSKVVAPRGRIVRRVDAWNDTSRHEFIHMCVDRAHQLALDAERPLADWAQTATAAMTEGPALMGFVAARIAEEVSGPDEYHRERRAQANWLVERLGLDQPGAS